MNNIITLPKFDSNEFPAQNSDYLKKLEDLEEKVNITLQLYKEADLGSKTLQEIKEARADLNKLTKFINDGKKAMKDAWFERLTPYEEKLRNLIGSIEYIEKSYGEKVREFEEIDRENKRKAIKQLFKISNIFGSMLSFDVVLRPEWLNKTYNLSKIETEIDDLIKKLKSSLYVIDMEKMSDGLKQICKIKLFETLELTDALAETRELAEKLASLRKFEETKTTKEVQQCL